LRIERCDEDVLAGIRRLRRADCPNARSILNGHSFVKEKDRIAAPPRANLPPIMTTYLKQSTAQTTVFETSIPWMYLDTRGLVTVGVGQMLPNLAAAQALTFHHPNGVPATPDAIHADFARVRALPAAQSCQAYRCATSLTLPGASITALLTAATTANDAALRARIPNYDALPTPAKLALLDMAYNLGTPKLLRQYPLLLAAVEGQHWLVASQQCHRTGPSPVRNRWTAQQFLLAAST
jgi:GH24 family phage-related lysozyme (muramidase)